MPRYFIELAYKGTRFHGWQIQPNAKTIQEELEKAFSLLLSQSVNIIGAGRTDAGVHAEFFTAHFDLNAPVQDIAQLLFRTNRILPADIAVYKMYPVPDDLHARFSATARSYRYQFAREKLPFASEFSHYVYGSIDLSAMQKAADILSEYSDFTSFSKLHTDTNNNLCTIHKAAFRETDGLLHFEISANRFLRNMVRAIAGTLLEIGRGNWDSEKIHSIIQQKDRSAAGPSLPGKALFLTHVAYPPVTPAFTQGFGLFEFSP